MDLFLDGCHGTGNLDVHFFQTGNLPTNIKKIGPWDLCWFKRWNIEKGNFSLIADICPECWTFIPIGIHCHLVPIGKHCTHVSGVLDF